MIVPFDLARDQNGKVIIGPETKIACDRAIKFAQQNPSSLIVATAGKAGKKWDVIWMSLVIGEYVVKYIDRDQFIAAQADEFSTWGEIEELFRLSSRMGWLDSEFILVAKWWHTPRVKFLCAYFFHGYNAHITTIPCNSLVNRNTIIKEFLIAWPLNIFRIIRDIL
jgi:hypothetical protein